jgi:hypothetical protein
MNTKAILKKGEFFLASLCLRGTDSLRRAGVLTFCRSAEPPENPEDLPPLQEPTLEHLESARKQEQSQNG